MDGWMDGYDGWNGLTLRTGRHDWMDMDGWMDIWMVDGWWMDAEDV